MGEAREETPGVEARSQLLAIERGTQQMALEREVLADRTKAREKGLGALGPAEASHAPLALTSGLMPVFGGSFTRVQALTNTCRTFARRGATADKARRAASRRSRAALGTIRNARAELVARASDPLVADDNAALEQ